MALASASDGGVPRQDLTSHFDLVLVDQLAATSEVGGDVERVLHSIAASGHRVRYVPPQSVDVDLYRNLGLGEFDLLVLRTHATRIVSGTDPATGEPIVGYRMTLFTNEPFTPGIHERELESGRVSVAYYDRSTGLGPQFAIDRSFIRSDMRGDLEGVEVFIMGCGGPGAAAMADAFLDRGASGVVAWDGDVTAAHNDVVMSALIEARSTSTTPLKDSTEAVLRRFGPDPAFGARLVLFED